MDDYRSSRIIALELDRRLAPNEKMMFFFDLQESALYYTRRQARKIRGNRVLSRYLQTEGNLIIIEKKTEHRLEDMRDEYEIVFEHGDKIIATGTSKKN